MAPEEETFRAYTQAQGDTYAAGRPGYSPELFKIIIAHHTSTSGQLNTVLDIGCGTGQATLDLAPYFANAIGLDPLEGMIGTARASAESANLLVRFEVLAAEALGTELKPPVADGSVDLARRRYGSPLVRHGTLFGLVRRASVSYRWSRFLPFLIT
ncbi:hypothetical protein F4824DRAFT_502119 [Ustulina deusta]|nr:hypothetical protein F4824DRAFT_502119 [Ustulina deusta]